MTTRAKWNDTLLAESNETIIVEGNHYFPPGDVKREYLTDSESHTHCPWKGEASYVSLNAGGSLNPDAAWYYPNPLPAAEVIRDYVAFWKGVQITSDPGDGQQGPTPPARSA
jgi:uncharacterized protein (DUF427 family)